MNRNYWLGIGMILLVIFLFPLKSPSFSIVETSGSIWNTAVLDVNPVVLNDSTPSTTVKLLFLADPRLTVGKCAPVLSWVYLDDTIAARQYKLATDGSQQLLQTININVQNLSQGKHTIRSVSFIAGWGASKFQQTAFQCEAPLLDLISTLESMNNVTPEHFTSSEILSYGFFVVQEQNVFKNIGISEDEAEPIFDRTLPPAPVPIPEPSPVPVPIQPSLFSWLYGLWLQFKSAVGL